jgi:LemA protein
MFLICIFLFFAGWFVVSFNKFIREKNLIKEAWSGIDVQLKRRYDLVASLVETVKGYVKYEKKILENVVSMRSKALDITNIKEREEKENAFSRGIKTVFAVAEGYPQLKANRSFLNLQKNLSEIEDQIQLARRYYNGTVRNYNTRIESFPSMIIASIFHFKQADFFEIEYATQRDVPEVKI